jgi:hypothetical protein
MELGVNRTLRGIVNDSFTLEIRETMQKNTLEIARLREELNKLVKKSKSFLCPDCGQLVFVRGAEVACSKCQLLLCLTCTTKSSDPDFQSNCLICKSEAQ